jgi:hypothetical protein
MIETEVVFEVKKRYHFFSSFFFELVDVLIVFEVYMYDTPKCEIRLDQEFLCTCGYVLTFLLFQRCMLLVLYIFQFSRNSRWIEWVRDCRETCKLEVLEPTSLVWIQNTYHIQNNVKTADLFSVLSKIENGFPYNSLKRTSVWNFIVFINLYYFLYYLLFVLLYCLTLMGVKCN